MTVKGMKFGAAFFGTVAMTALSLGTAVAAQAQTIKIDGSSTVYPVTEKVAESFQKANPGTKVTVGVSGTGGGFKKFCSGETVISNASRPVKDSEKQACADKGIQFKEIQVGIDGLAVVINPRNTWAETLTMAQLKKIWEPEAEKKITRWNQIDPSFPNAPIKLFGPGPDSGTFDFFTEEVVGKSRASRKDYVPSEDDNVLVQGVARDRNALGYFGYAYYLANKNRIKSVAVDGVKPSDETIDNKTYKLARPLFIYVNTEAMKRPEVRKFVEYYVNNSVEYSTAVGYHAAPPKKIEEAKEFLRTTASR